MQKLKNLIKNSFLGWLFLAISIVFIKILQIFIKPNSKSVIFMSYGGRQISDSPNEVYLNMINDDDFKDWNLKWALNKPKLFQQISKENKISSNSPLYFYHLLKSKYWITNSSIERLIPFKHRRNIYIQFWHGMPMKTLGDDEKELSGVVKWWYSHAKFDFHFVYGDFDRKHMQHVFKNSHNIINHGLLRKSILNRRSKIGINKLRHEMEIESNKPVLLYVPSFREYKTKKSPFLSDEFLAKLSKDYTIIYRGHYYSESEKTSLDIKYFANKSLYKLMLVSDFMVTDYSSVIFDYLPLRRPIYLFQSDINEYTEHRGLYLRGEDLQLPVAYSENTLNEQIKNDRYNYQQLDILLEKYNNEPMTRAWEDIRNILDKENKRN
ncbi:hypothetical protein G7084_05470 [Weissella coleopterorum]|uniref:CDP-glycerol glycerophosphotransferase n=1 Tax=Weissella coleopterorum TaxID=2714949 RepID=A0A6G8B0Q4_9LACO|nr:CDP-glycerol glycerophosphotransferase family protein [Weissella coleopterorum]QIL50810.1 hypothetical protein G7084_05470 [Weissella coleopterorum]